MASTSSYQPPTPSVAPALVFGRPPPGASSSSSTPVLPDPNLPRSVVLDNATEKSGGRLKKFMCTWPGCGKCYTRPARLEEHQRVHTGERPFACDQCSSTFARDSHLKAHMRTHSTQTEKKYPCKEEGCDKKFWTNQHLKKHIEVVHRGKTYDCPSCDDTFRKHHQLRTHIAEEHSAPGTDPFQCEHPGCNRSFKQKVHLKAHEKTHDPSRYVCLHPSCLALPLASRQFPTWTLLQRHTKTAHPPTCPHPACKGKTFTTNRGLRNHLVLHEGDVKPEEDAGGTTTDAEGAGVDEMGKKKKKTKQKRRPRGRKRRMGEEEDEEDVVKPRKKRKRAVKAEVVSDNEADEDGEGDGEVEEEEEEEEAQFTAEEDEEEGEEEWGSEWEEEQERSRDERMREDFRHGGKKKRRVLAEADGFPALAFPPLPPFPLQPLPDPTLSTSSCDEHGGALAAPIPAKKSAFFDLITGANYAQPVLPVPPPTPSSSRPKSPKKETLDDDAAYDPSLDRDAEREAHHKPHLRSPSSRARTPAPLPRKYPCPFPAILGLPFRDVGPGAHGDEPEHAGVDEDSDTEGMCGFWFKRCYDVERHLRARHGVEMVGGRGVLEEWYEAEAE
ncbi:hypothetical protein JCM6882_009035 [Rhodosporidiobolus microsporus]